MAVPVAVPEDHSPIEHSRDNEVPALAESRDGAGGSCEAVGVENAVLRPNVLGQLLLQVHVHV